MGKKEIEQTEEQVEESIDQVMKLKEEVEQYDNKYKRAIADYQNLEKRVAEQRRELIQSANKQLLLTLLPVLDTMYMAQAHNPDQGLQLTLKQFTDTLQDEGVIRIETVGKQFDPYTMEAISTEDGEDGMVLEELRAGYMLYERVLRPAQVKVGKKETNK